MTIGSSDAVLYVSDQSNNKIKMVELTSGLYKSVTIDSNVDPSGSLGGLTYYNLNLYACITGAIVKYTISSTTYVATTSKTLFSGNYAGLLYLHVNNVLT